MSFSFPSYKKIQELRRRGIVSYSSWLTRLIVLAGLFGYFYFEGERLLSNLIGYYQQLVNFERDSSLLILWEYFSASLIDFFVIPAVLILGLIFLGIFAQTRFYLKFDNFTPDLSRLGIQHQLRTIKPIKRILLCLASPILCCLAVILVVDWSKKLVPTFSWLASESLSGYLSLFKSIASQITVVAVLFMILATILNWFYFRFEHRQGENDSPEESEHQSAIESIK